MMRRFRIAALYTAVAIVSIIANYRLGRKYVFSGSEYETGPVAGVTLGIDETA